MAFLTPMSQPQARDLASRFGVTLARFEPLAAGSVNSNFRFLAEDGAAYFARVYEEQGPAGAQNEVELLTALDREGVPVVCPLATRDGQRTVEFQDKPFALFPWVAGNWLCLGKVTPAHCETLGAALATLHRASTRIRPLPEGRFRPEDLLQRLDQVEALDCLALVASVGRIRAAYGAYLPRRRPLPAGICHGDLFRDNVLWDGPKLAALLDFESASWGSWVYDLMVTALAWCFTDSFEKERVRALFQGYASVRIPSVEERAALEVEGALACLRFATTRITDFELRTPKGQRPGRDFRRFLRRLEVLESGVLESLREELAGADPTERNES